MKLTERQRSVLTTISEYRHWHFDAWDLGTPTCEALRKRGLIDHGGGDRPFTTGTRFNESVRITDAGLAALSALENGSASLADATPKSHPAGEKEGRS